MGIVHHTRGDVGNMAVMFELVRRPRTRIMRPVIRRELLQAYQPFKTMIPADIIKELQGWKAYPEITVRIKVSGKRYTVSVHIDKRTKMGKIYWWVDQGTGLDGPQHSTYVIEPVVADFLQFDVPYQPNTMPTEPLRYNPNEPSHTMRSLHIDHPGIQARNISEKVMRKYRDRKNRQGFYRVTENAYRRGYRRLGWTK